MQQGFDGRADGGLDQRRGHHDTTTARFEGREKLPDAGSALTTWKK